MYTQCPACRTIFEIDEDALQASLGIVRCGHCEQRFDALRTLSDALPAEPDAALPEQDAEARTPTLTEAVSPDVLKAAAKPRRKKRKPASETPTAESSSAPVPAAEVESKAEPASAADMQAPPATDPPTHWFTPSLDERTRALIADAAGIPHEAINADPDWQVIDLPEPSASGELDIIPMAEDAATPAADITASAAVDEAPTVAAPVAHRHSDIITVVEPDAPATDASLPALADVAFDELVPDATAPADHTGIITVVEPEAAAAPPPAAPVSKPTVEPIEPVDAVATPMDVDSLPVDAIANTAPAAANAPVYVPPRPRRIHPHDWLWALGCLLLLIALAAQLAWANRVNLLRDPATQPTVLNICARIRCDMPPVRAIAKLELLSRDVRPDPKTAGALLITATLRNNAHFTQPWPVVVVRLLDIDNTPVAMRRFRPTDYLPDAARRAAGLAPGTTAAVAFEVADPGPRAVAFHFSFD